MIIPPFAERWAGAGQRIGQRLGVQDGEPGHGPGESHVEPLQAPGLGTGDASGLDHDDVIELESLGQRDRDQREPGVRARLAVIQPRAVERSGQGPDLRVGGDDGNRPGAGQGLCAGRGELRAQRGAGTRTTSSAPGSARNEDAGCSSGAITASSAEA